MTDEHCDLFISSSPKDRSWVTEFVSALRKEGMHPWSDAEITPGENWEEAIGKALRESTALVMVLNPDNAQSAWTFFQLGAAIADRKKIIPVAPKALDWSRLPIMLRHYQFLNESSPSIAGKRVAEVVGKPKSAEIQAQGSA